MNIKICDFVIQYQDSEGLRRSIPYAVQLLAKERFELEASKALFKGTAWTDCITAIEADLQKIEQAEAILARLTRKESAQRAANNHMLKFAGNLWRNP